MVCFTHCNASQSGHDFREKMAMVAPARDPVRTLLTHNTSTHSCRPSSCRSRHCIMDGAWVVMMRSYWYRMIVYRRYGWRYLANESAGRSTLPLVYCLSRMTLFFVVCLFEPTALSLAICYIRFTFFLSIVVIIGGVHFLLLRVSTTKQYIYPSCICILAVYSSSFYPTPSRLWSAQG